MIQDRNQGVFVEDLIHQKMRFREGGRTTMLPRIAPQTSTSVGVKTTLRNDRKEYVMQSHIGP